MTMPAAINNPNPERLARERTDRPLAEAERSILNKYDIGFAARPAIAAREYPTDRFGSTEFPDRLDIIGSIVMEG
jgi:hypothetical protein